MEARVIEEVEHFFETKSGGGNTLPSQNLDMAEGIQVVLDLLNET